MYSKMIVGAIWLYFIAKNHGRGEENLRAKMLG